MAESKVEISGGSTKVADSQGVRVGVVSGGDGGEVKLANHEAYVQEGKDVDVGVIKANKQEKQQAQTQNDDTDLGLRQVISQYMGTHVVEKVIILMTIALVLIFFIVTR